MSLRSRWLFVAILALALPTLASCNKKSESETMTPATAVAVTTVDLGRSIGSDYRVTEKMDTFTPKDVIYTTVITSGASPSAILKATWTFQDGQVIDTTERTIAPTGETATEFHITKPDGFPVGKYTLDVYLDGNKVQTKTFEVKAG
jgi:hypothetical protein